jgi:hypothetical protein
VSVSRKVVKTPLGTVEYLWINGGLVPYDVLRQEWLENKKGEPDRLPSRRVRTSFTLLSWRTE